MCGCDNSVRVDVSTEDAQRKTFATATEQGGRCKRAYRSIRIHRSSSASLRGGCECQDGSVVGEEVIGGSHAIGCGVATTSLGD
jgi:hypothetical protein